ncbi:carbohydrate binding domain-containing protein [Paenibacillus sp. LPE1-1-1.1]|uniref:carbohydrate binding domain-containing protein n=1 Tax=Paenibacillus sp. LPE1-1-1.1 TaxID=3135230 RepID=UPI003447E8B4
MDGLPRYWSTLFDVTSSTSTERKRSGERSVKITDSKNNGGIGLRSARIPVTPGLKYEAYAYAYIEGGSAAVYIEFLNEAGGELTLANAGITSLNEWKEARVSSIAPPTAKYATVRLYLGAANVGTTYFDDAGFRDVLPDLSANLINGQFELIDHGRTSNWRAVDGIVAWQFTFMLCSLIDLLKMMSLNIGGFVWGMKRTSTPRKALRSA